MHTLFAPTNRWRAYGLGGCLIATCLVLVPPASAQPAKTRTDALGDPLPEGALYRIGTTRLHPGAPVEAMTFSADGKSLITATLATGVHVWEVATGKELRALPPVDEPINAVVLSDGGDFVAVVDRAGVLVMRRISTGAEVCRLPRTFDRSASLHFSPDASQLAVVGNQQIDLRDTATLKRQRVLPAGPRPPEAARPAFAPDGKTLAIPGFLVGATLYDAATGKRLRSFGAPRNDMLELLTSDGNVSALAFSPDGKALASLDLSTQRIRVWDVATGDARVVIMLEPTSGSSLLFSSDSKRLFAMEAGKVTEWDLATGKRLRSFPGSGDAEGRLALSPDGKVLAVAGNYIRLWDLTTGKELLAQDRPGWQHAPDHAHRQSGNRQRQSGRR